MFWDNSPLQKKTPADSLLAGSSLAAAAAAAVVVVATVTLCLTLSSTRRWMSFVPKVVDGIAEVEAEAAVAVAVVVMMAIIIVVVVAVVVVALLLLARHHLRIPVRSTPSHTL